MSQQFFCPHCDHCSRLKEAAKPFVPKMSSFPQFSSLPLANVLAIFQKLNPSSFIRLRGTCHQMNNFAEEQRSSIGVKLQKINLIPNTDTLDQHLRPITVTEPVLVVCAKQRTEQRIKVSEAFYRLSGFTYDRVDIRLYRKEAAFPHLALHHRQELLKVIRSQKWRCTGMAMDCWPPEPILHIIRPKILRLINREIASCPSSVETIVMDWYNCEEKGLQLIKSLPPVKNILIDNDFGVSPKSLQFLKDFTSQIIELFYADKLSAEHVQVRGLILSIQILRQIIGESRNNEASRLLLDELLHGTSSFREESTFSSAIQTNIYEEQWVAAGNALLTSFSGQKGLFAIRIEDVYHDPENHLLTSFSKESRKFGGWNWEPRYLENSIEAIRTKNYPKKMEKYLAVSVYFWREKMEFIHANDPYYQIESDGIYTHEMRSF